MTLEQIDGDDILGSIINYHFIYVLWCMEESGMIKRINNHFGYRHDYCCCSYCSAYVYLWSICHVYPQPIYDVSSRGYRSYEHAG